MKQNKQEVSLAIGDGANDVNMIQAADVGIGIYGNEGLRAAQSSDFAIGQFQDIWRLLFFHGYHNYYRVTTMILYFFFKNIIFTLPQFLFAFYSLYSAQSVYDDWFITFYNMIFTAMPLLVLAVFDYHFNYIYLDNNHQLKHLPEVKAVMPHLYFIG